MLTSGVAEPAVVLFVPGGSATEVRGSLRLCCGYTWQGYRLPPNMGQGLKTESFVVVYFIQTIKNEFCSSVLVMCLYRGSAQTGPGAGVLQGPGDPQQVQLYFYVSVKTKCKQ